MGKLFEKLQALVKTGRYIVGQHAAERLDERKVLEWQVVDGLDEAQLIAERPNATPNPAVETRQWLADGTQVQVVWSHLAAADLAKLVTVYFLGDDE